MRVLLLNDTILVTISEIFKHCRIDLNIFDDFNIFLALFFDPRVWLVLRDVVLEYTFIRYFLGFVFFPLDDSWNFAFDMLTNLSVDIGSIRILLLLFRFNGFSVLIFWSIDLEVGSYFFAVTTNELHFILWLSQAPTYCVALCCYFTTFNYAWDLVKFSFRIFFLHVDFCFFFPCFGGVYYSSFSSIIVSANFF